MKYKSADHKLKHARQLFEDAVDHHETAHAEAHRAERYYHNSDCEGQYEPADLDYLRENNRMALTFNILKTKLDTFLGMYADAQRTPTVSAASGSDGLAAEILDAVKTQLLQDANHESLAARQLKTGTITGACSLHIEVLPSDDGPGWVRINLYRVMPYEELWDICSIEPDRSDARHVFWFRWLTKAEFLSEYPDAQAEWDSFAGTEEGQSLTPMQFGESTASDNPTRSGDYQNPKDGRYYYNRKSGKIRVIRYEYKTTHDQRVAIDLETGERHKLDAKREKQVSAAITIGAPYQIVDTVEERTEVCEFIGSKLLAEYDEAGPFKGFSLIPYCYEIDEETCTAYGLLRNLFDPQMELNKSRSLALELDAQATMPGTIAEIGAIPDRKQYEAERRRPNGIALVERGALSEQAPKLIERQPQQPSALAAARATAAMQLLDEVSAIPSAANLTAAEHAQAGVTVAIRYHKSRQTVSTPFSHFEMSQRKLVEKVTEIVVNVMPDDQILAILGSREDLVIQGRQVTEIEPGPPGPTGQPSMVPKRMADLSDVRSIKWRLDMEYTSENSTLRMLELEILLAIEMARPGTIDPEVMIERASNSRTMRERLKSYLDKQRAAQAEGARAESDALRATSEGALHIEAGKVAETRRHNMETERQAAIETAIDAELKRLDLELSAQVKSMDIDEGHKDRLLEVVRMASQERVKRNQSGGMRSGAQ